MELTGDVLIATSPERVWVALNDPEVLRTCIPGCEEVQRVSVTETQVRAMVKMGPVRARFVGKILMSEVRPGEGCTLHFEGSGGAAGFAKGRSTVNLTPDGAGTRLGYTATASVGGKLGQVGGRMIDAAAKHTADQFFAALGQHLAPPAADDAVSLKPTEPSASTPASDTLPAFTPARQYADAPGALPPAAAEQQRLGEGLRVLWFVVGATAGAAFTAFGFWLARVSCVS